MGLISKSVLDKIIREEILYEKGVQTRKVFTEKYTERQKRSAMANALADMIINAAIKQMEDEGNA